MFKMGKGKLKNEMDLRNGLGTYNYQTFDTHYDNFSQFLLGPSWPFCGAILPHFLGAINSIRKPLQLYLPLILVQKIHSPFFLYKTRQYFTLYYLLISMGLKGQNGGLKMFKMGKGKLKNEMNLKNGLGTYNYQTFDTHDDNFSQFFT